MATYLMFGKYSPDSLKEISAKRTDKANKLLKKFGGDVKSAYALLGDHDLVLIADFPTNSAAMQASVELGKLTGIGFTTSPAVTIEEFDKMAGQA